ncbi:PHD finger domain-containing protein [Sporobolomyces koalae]|uniref:PHD finger domain-containing protein n=1 Tax=Sporobolomyces koalae TaxID=500713 RepID=UPI003177572A
MALTYSTTSSAAADEFGDLSLAVASGSSPIPSRHSSPSSSLRARSSSVASSGPESTLPQPGPKRRERQTRLQEHLRTVKPGSASSHSSNPKPTLGFSVAASMSASKTLPRRSSGLTAHHDEPTSSRPKRKAAQKVVMHELVADSDYDSPATEDVDMDEQDELDADDFETQVSPRGRKTARRARGRPAMAAAKKPREREISNLSTISAGIDVECMDEDEVQNRLEIEKNELMERLAQHGINPQADVLDRALRTLSSSNEKLTVESFLRALSSLDTNRSPVSAGLPIPPPALSVQVPNSNQSKRVSFSTLESPSTPSSTHSTLFPSPPTKSAALPVANPASRSARLSASTGASGSISPSIIMSMPSTSASATASNAVATTSSLFGTAPGMGRIALARRHTYLGVPSASDPVPSLLPAFQPGRKPTDPSTSPSKPIKTAGAASSVSKLQSWLDDDDSEEEDSLAKPPILKASMMQSAVDASKASDEEMEIRVGGKSVKVLRKRVLEETGEDSPDPVTLSPRDSKGKQRALDCICGETVSKDESAHGTISCKLCETSFHLACLSVNSRRHLPLEWECEQCTTNQSASGSQTADASVKDSFETPQKRARTGGSSMTTPPLSSEPTFVDSTFSPIPRGNFEACPDIALAPSPTSSPKRQYAAVPTSPLLSASKVAIPATPQFGKESDPRSDYSPCSPLFSRKSRSRLVSGVFDSAPFGSDWTTEFDDTLAPFGDSLGPMWDPSTPSRVAGSAGGGGTTGWETPFASRSRQPTTLHTQSVNHLRTPSQDIFSGSALDYVQGGRHTAPAQMFAQRLFGGGDDPASPSRILSPAATKRSQRHYRNPSSHYILPPHAFQSPSSGSGSIFSQFPPTPQSGSGSLHSMRTAAGFHNASSPSRPSLQSSAMKSSLSAPGMLRSASDGLGIGFDEPTVPDEASHFDDLLL